MITKEYKELAEEYGLNIAAGVAYGSLNGLAVTMYCVGKKKAMAFATKFSDPVGQANLNDAIAQTNPTTKFYLKEFCMAPDRVLITFQNLPDDTTHIRAFLQWFLPLLASSGASPYNLCPECGFQISDGKWKLVGNMACYVHTSCEERIVRTYGTVRKGFYISGIIGAIIGMGIGTLLWVAFQKQGYMTAAASLAVGVFTGWGYNLLYGREGKGRFSILAIFIALGVTIGTFAPDFRAYSEMVPTNEMIHLSFFNSIWNRLCVDSDYMWNFIKVFISGLLFASCGCGVMIEKTGKKFKKRKVMDLP